MELFYLFNQVGISKDILTDQGTPFVAHLITDLCQLLQVKHLKTSIYSPQMDGLVKWFTQTLKHMLKRVIDEEGMNLDHFLPYIFFAILRIPKASTRSPHLNFFLDSNLMNCWMWPKKYIQEYYIQELQ